MQAEPLDQLRVDDSTANAGFLDLLILLAQRWRSLLLLPLAVGLVALGVSFMLPPIFTSTTVLLPPQQPQSATSGVLASLGALAGAVGGGGGTRTASDQYVALMQSVTLEARIIDLFKLDSVYGTDYRFQTHKALKEAVRISSDRRSGLISIIVEDRNAKRAADIANAFVAQLRSLTSELAITEAQQRRVFFEQQLKRTRERLTTAQAALQGSGFSQSTLRAEPRSATDGYARLLAELTAAEVKLQVMRGYLTDQAAEMQQQVAVVSGLRSQIARLEAAPQLTTNSDYISKYREFKYQETLFELFSRQFEAARVDESRDGPLVQVIDVAQPAEYKTRPSRGLIAILAALAAGLLWVSWLVVSHWLGTTARRDPAFSSGLQRLRQAFRHR